MNTATVTRTVEARIWKVRPAAQGGYVVLLWLGQREGDRQFRTRVPLSDSDRVTWFNITLVDNVITGVAAI